jgi:putative peptide zinc metalloprotease protein
MRAVRQRLARTLRTARPDTTTGLLVSPERPRLVPGVELAGRYRGSGFRERRYLVCRDDGQWVQLTPLLYQVANALDGERTIVDVAATVSRRVERDVSADNVVFLLARLDELGLLAPPRAQPAQLDLLLGLRVRKAWVPARVVRPVARVLSPLFHPLVVLAVVAGFGATVVTMLSGDRLVAAGDELLTRPIEALAVVAVVLAGVFFHELGHASACTYSGGTPGEIGGGFYLFWPALYTNVTESYRLRKSGRVRTDLGGVYFNALFCVLAAIAYALTGWSGLVAVVAAVSLIMVEQLLPFVRFDGYWVLSDLAGVPDLFPRLRAALGRLLPWRRVSPALADLKPRARRVIVVWAVVTAVVLPLQFALMLLVAPSLVASTWFELAAIGGDVTAAAGAHHWAAVALAVVQAVMVTVFLVGLVGALVYFVHRAVRATARRCGPSLVRRLPATVAVVAAFAAPVAWSASQVRFVHT